MDIVYIKPEVEKKKCLCCGKDIFVLPMFEQELCNSCYIITCREVFNKQNNNLTIKQLRNKIKTLI